MNDINRFNLRVYGLLISEGKILVADEIMGDYSFSKFPGGGLEYGEGIADALKREFREELDIAIEIGDLFYINDFFQQSAFKKSDQLISIYYRVSSLEMGKIESWIQSGYQLVAENHQINFRWQKIEHLDEARMTFPIDKLIAKKLRTIF